jgi:hypothetical protein
LTGLAVILGRISGGLWARDFDDMRGYEAWAAAYPEIAGQIPTVRTKRGVQVFAYHAPAVKFIDFGNGELRGEGHYSLLPPSRHPDGPTYAWLIAGPEVKLTLDPGEVRLNTRWDGEEEGMSVTQTHSTTGTQKPKETQDTQAVAPPSGIPGGEVPSLAVLLTRAVPTDEHTNHACLWELARGVRGLEEQEGGRWPEADLWKRVFIPWYRAAHPLLRSNQSQDEYWIEFLESYHNVKHPLGEGVLDLTLKRALVAPPPPEAEQFTDQKIQRLVAWCRELQRTLPDSPFFLSTRTVVARLGFGTPMAALRVLRHLARRKILERVTTGGHGTRDAATFWYRGKL